MKKKKWLVIILGGFFVLGAFFLKGGNRQQYVFSSSTCPLPQGGGKIVSIPASTDWVSAINGLKPGDVAQLEARTYYPTGKKATVSGTATEPITICGSGYLETTIDGNKGSAALHIDKSTYVVLQNVQVTNPSPRGVSLDPDDPTHTYSNTARNKLDPADPEYSTLAEGILLQGGSSYITIKDSYFHDVATRGILGGASDSHHVTIEHNMFFHVGDDTASSDMSWGSNGTNFTIRENLFGGNVDGVMVNGVGAGHLIERNLFVSHNWEDGIDIKGHRPIGSEYPWSIVQHNVIYANKIHFGGITVQNDSDYVKVYENIIHGHGGYDDGVEYKDKGAGIIIYGREHPVDNDRVVSNVHVAGNWLDGYGKGGRAISLSTTSDPAGAIPIKDVWILHNIITDYDKYAVLYQPTDNNINFYDNILNGGIPDIKPVVQGSNNLFVPPTTTWGGVPITGVPVYIESPVGPLATGSIGKDQAEVAAVQVAYDEWQKEMGYPLGTDVGFSPQTHLIDLEGSILCSIKTVFTDADIAKVMEQAELPYTPPSNCGSAPIVSPSPTSPPTPQMTFTKSANTLTAQSGNIVTYTINYSNTGSVDVVNMVIADIIPTGSSYIQNSASAGGVFDGTQVTWNIALVKPGVSGSVTFQVKVN